MYYRPQIEHDDDTDGPSAESGALGGVVRGGSQVAAAKMRVGVHAQEGRRRALVAVMRAKHDTLVEQR